MSNSLGAGSPVRSSAGRTLAAIPKSVIQTSPGLTAGIFVLQAIEHEGSFQRRLIALRDVGVPIGNFQQHFSNCPAVSLAKVWQFFKDLSYAHVDKLEDSSLVVRSEICSHAGWFNRSPGFGRTEAVGDQTA